MSTTFNRLNIKKVKNCYNSDSFIGYINDKQYTECYDTIGELKEQNDIFKDLEIISEREWDKIPNDYKGIYSDLQGCSPEKKGLKTKLKLINGATCLVFEHIHFIILNQ